MNEVDLSYKIMTITKKMKVGDKFYEYCNGKLYKSKIVLKAREGVYVKRDDGHIGICYYGDECFPTKKDAVLDHLISQFSRRNWLRVDYVDYSYDITAPPEEIAEKFDMAKRAALAHQESVLVRIENIRKGIEKP